MEKIEPLALKGIVATLIILFSVTGCSDMPYTGAVLPVNEVDRYLVSTDGNVVCFEDDIDSTCIKVGAETADGTDTTNSSAIHIYPERRLYLFYHEGNPIVRARRVDPSEEDPPTDGSPPGNGSGGGGGNGDGSPPTNGGSGGGGNDDGPPPVNDGSGGGGEGDGSPPGNGGADGDGNGDGSPPGNGGSGNGDASPPANGGGDGGGNGDGSPPGNGGSGEGDGSPPANGGGDGGGNNEDPPGNSGPPTNPTNPDGADGHGWIIWVYYPDGVIPRNRPTLSESGVTITINGKQLTDDDITGFAQFIGPNNEKGIQFFYATESAELLDLKVQMEGLVDTGDPVKFNINYLWSSD